MKKILCIFFCLLPILGGKAQTLYKDQVRIEKESITRSEDNNVLTINLDIVLKENLKLESNNVATLTPFLEANGKTKVLSSIVVYGRKRDIVNQRNHKAPENTYTILRRKQHQEQKVNYLVQMPFEAWMRNANMKLNIDLCGCCDILEENSGELITQLNILPLKVKPSIAYITPKAEDIKYRAVEGSAFLDFPVNKSVILTDFMNNHTELVNIHSMFAKIQNDKNLTIKGIGIEGFASPEGPLAFNEQLSKKRAEALKDYLVKNEKVSSKLYKVTFGGENWDGLVKALKSSSMKDKETFLNIIKNTTDDAKRKQEIMRVGGGAPYRSMLKEIYPGLRKVNCKIDYTVVNFDVEQGRIIIRENPKYLSLNEMYQVANSYPKGSKDFVNVFDIAVRMYPTDQVANLNAAAVALSQKDLNTAVKYMEKADHTTAEFMNNTGVYNFLNGDIQRAMAAFEQAAKLGNEAAQANLKQLQQILNVKMK